jgi:hypothetical protein
MPGELRADIEFQRRNWSGAGVRFGSDKLDYRSMIAPIRGMPKKVKLESGPTQL